MKSRTISKIIRILIAGVNNYYAAVQKALAVQKNQ